MRWIFVIFVTMMAYFAWDYHRKAYAGPFWDYLQHGPMLLLFILFFAGRIVLRRSLARK